MNTDFKENVSTEYNYAAELVRAMNLEPLLRDDPTRYVVFPIVYHSMWGMYQQAEALFWKVESVDLSNDHKDWEEKLTTNERTFYKHVFAYFACDKVLCSKLVKKLTIHLTASEAKIFFGMQNTMKNMHSQMYNKLMDTFVNKEEKAILLKQIKKVICMRSRDEWVKEWVSNDSVTFGENVVVSAAVAQIYFCSSLATIFRLKKRGLMPGLTFSNDLVHKDTALHYKFACMVYTHVVHKPSEERVQNLIKEIVDLEKEFVTGVLPFSLIELDPELVCQYVEFIADKLLTDLGVSKMYNSQNPFDYMDNLPNEVKANSSERKATQSKITDAFAIDENF